MSHLFVFCSIEEDLTQLETMNRDWERKACLHLDRQPSLLEFTCASTLLRKRRFHLSSHFSKTSEVIASCARLRGRMIHDAGLHFDVLSLLQGQQRSYTVQLGLAHQALSKLYKRLASIEHELDQRLEKGLTRKEKKKLQWSRSQAKHAVGEIESHQAILHEYLRQCDSLMTSYTSQYPAQGMSPANPIVYEINTGPPPWAYGNSDANQSDPQYWDLSMLSERDESSPHTGGPSDLGAIASAPNHGTIETGARINRANTSSSATDARQALEWFKFPDSSGPLSHTREGAGADLGSSDNDKGDTPSLSPRHSRRLSENAIQIIEARLAANASTRRQSCSHKRGVSWAGSTTISMSRMLPPIQGECEAEGS